MVRLQLLKCLAVILSAGVITQRSVVQISIIFLTVIGSGLGALLLLAVPVRALQTIIAVAMIAVAVFSIQNRYLGTATHDAPPSRAIEMTGYVATFFPESTEAFSVAVT